MFKLFLDAGHGGKDSGAVNGSIYEKNLVMTIQQHLIAYLTATFSDISINTTRTTDVFLELSERAEKANKWGADAFVSLHVNAGGGTGYESYVYTKPSSNSLKLQKAINDKALTAAGTYGLKAHGNAPAKQANLAVCRLSDMPAVLTEVCYIDSKDLDLLKQDAFLKAMAIAYGEGIAAYANLTRKKVVSQPVSSDKKTYYRVVASSFLDKKTAEQHQAKLKKAGFDSFIDVYQK